MNISLRMYKCPDRIAAQKAFDAYRAAEEKAAAKHYGNFESMMEKLEEDAEEEKFDQIRADLQKKYGIPGGLRHESVTAIYQDSACQPSHLFKLGYLMSSWDANSFDNIMETFGIATLLDIFQVPKRGELPPYLDVDWKEAERRCQIAILEFERHMVGPYARYTVLEVTTTKDAGVRNGCEALESLNRQILKHTVGSEGGRTLSSESFWRVEDGLYSQKPMKVAAIVRRNPPTDYPNLMGPSFFVVQEAEDSTHKVWYWYALNIVRENIQYVLEQPDSEQYYLVATR